MSSLPIILTSDFTRLFTSPTFEIVAGTDGKTFTVHTAVLLKSEVLERAIQGGWKESVERRIDWPEWDECTVGRLVEWLYTGDYGCPYPTPIREPFVKEREVSWSEPHGPEAIGFTDNLNGNRKGRKWDPLAHVANITIEESTLSHKPSELEKFVQWMRNEHWIIPSLTFAEVLLTHARVYALANYLMLHDLKVQAFYRLKAVLLVVGPLHSETQFVVDLVTVIRYVYANTESLATDRVPLRKAILTYLALCIEDFIGEDVDDLLANEPVFAAEMIPVMRDIMREKDNKISNLRNRTDQWRTWSRKNRNR